ncbi:nitrous oxide reductase accessory protein NosL/NosD [Natrinema ejinorense]|uniref:Nitrous oxide reductase accessory protein NosL/NosD n=1 Tax=Natrinema ejinorense TaxID=373386 RepID=A0A2A5QQJ5_9EURY|nr:nitrous oxide reductase accessory protein NosL/NosD [Natrinema ejinorense]
MRTRWYISRRDQPSNVPVRSRNTIFLGLLVVVVLASVGLFAADVGSTTPDPVAFDETVPVGLTLEAEYALGDDVALPRAQVFYSQYQYVVGYYGVETFVEDRRGPDHEQRFGHSLAVYVTDYGGTGIELTDEGYPVTDRSPGWIEAEAAWYVVDSDARTPAGDTVVSFADRDEAAAFAQTHGGTLHAWDSLLEVPFESDDASIARERVDDRRDLADERVEAAAGATERPTSVVVGEDADTIQAAIDDAPANTTVVVPEGTYAETIEIDRPITLAGEGNATIRGDGNSTVITVTTDRAAILGLDIEGVGNKTRDAEELPVEMDDEAWDATFTKYYAGTDAGIGAYTAEGLLVEDVRIDTPASGIITYDSTDAVIRNVTVTGTDDPTEGLAGMLLYHSPVVVENSTVLGSRNGIYLYRSPTAVVRSNEIEGNKLGVHVMHTNDALIADNELRGQEHTGIYIMTGPVRNAVVGNTVRDTGYALTTGGSDTYIASNLLTDSDIGLLVGSTASIYEDNVIAGNDLGTEVFSLLPTNRVVGNDFVGNDAHADVRSGPLRVWSDGDTGNYWQGSATVADGDRADLSYAPTDAVDGRLHRTDGAPTLVRAPALRALGGLEGSVPGMRTGSIVDQAPTCEPNNPDLLERTEWADDAWTCYETTRTTP